MKKTKLEAKYSCRVVQKVSAICGLKLIAKRVARWSISWLWEESVRIGFCSRAKVIAKRSILETTAKAKGRAKAKAKAKPFQRDNQLISQAVNGKCFIFLFYFAGSYAFLTFLSG